MKKQTFLFHLRVLGEELFVSSLIAYLVLLLLETITEGFVSQFFNLNYLLIVVLISGIITTITKKDREEVITRQETNSKWERYYVWLLSLGGGILVFYKTEELGYLSLVIAGVTILLIFFLSTLIMSDTNNK